VIFADCRQSRRQGFHKDAEPASQDTKRSICCILQDRRWSEGSGASPRPPGGGGVRGDPGKGGCAIIHNPPKPSTLTDFLTITETAERLKVSPKTVRRWIARGDLKIHRFGRQIRVSEGDFKAFTARHREA